MSGRLARLVLAVGRISRLVALTVVATPVLLVRNLFGPHAGPRVLRWYFEACGGGYVKIGQLLATRYDLLRVEYTDELGRLLDSLRPVPTARITQEIERSLGRPVAETFASFETQPLATASLAQVHGAVLADGDEVVVKVLKPGIGDRVRIDLRFLRLCARLLDLLPVLRGMEVGGLIDELSRTALDELDLSREAMYTAYLHEQMTADAIDHYAPRVYPSLSRGNVLTLERIRGVTVREMLAATTNGRNEELEAWAARGITPRRTAIILLRSVLEQTMRYRSFNADPHPSNLIVSDGGTLNWVDFGAVGWIDERQWDQQLRLRDAIANEQIHAAYLALLEAMEPLPYRNLRGFEQEIKRNLSDFLIASHDPGAPLSQKSTGAFLLKMLATLRRNGMPMTSSAVQLYRTILVSDIVMLGLYPTIDWRGHLRRFNRDLSTDLARRSVLDPATSPYTWYRLARAPMAITETMEWVTRRLPDIGRQTLRTLSAGERLIPYALRLLRRVSAAAILAALALAVFTPHVSARGALGRFVLRIEDNPWPAVAIGVIAVLVLSNLIRNLEGEVARVG
ncbi:MAG TPA: AarF/UbiB family protein [Acidimicrobiales bacterium]|nr:AarF/UbiB family protein [Acidimicrobiales bacterium]